MYSGTNEYPYTSAHAHTYSLELINLDFRLHHGSASISNAHPGAIQKVTEKVHIIQKGLL